MAKRNNSQKVLLETERLASFPKLNPNPVLEVDTSGKVIFCNAATIQTLKKLKLKEDPRLFLPADLKKILKELREKKETRFRREVGLGNSLFEENIRFAPEFKTAHIYTYEITERKQAAENIKKLLDETIEALSKLSKIRDPYTAGHENRVAALATAIARKMGLSENRVEGIRIASLLHDVGKITIPAEILSKPTSLSEFEFSIVKQHSLASSEILENIDFPWEVAKTTLQHHERINSSGYPQGLSGNKIILEAKILAVADVVEAMSSHRPYRSALGTGKALEEISKNRGILYEPEVVDACLNVFEKGFKCEPGPAGPEEGELPTNQ